MATREKKRGASEAKRTFSFVEDLKSEEHEPHLHRHFRLALEELHELERWMKKGKIKNHWSLTEKLAFLRNVESHIRTNAAVRRTELAWWAFMTGVFAAVIGFMVGLLAAE